MKLRYRAAARLDIQEAREWYGASSAELEGRFAEELHRTLSLVMERPRAYQVVEAGVRRAVLRVFPYVVYYYIARESRVVVLAVLHGSQHPDTWKRRR